MSASLILAAFRALEAPSDAAVDQRVYSHIDTANRYNLYVAPFHQIAIVKAGTALAVVEDACVGAFDIYLSTGASEPDQVVAFTLKAIWENVEKLGPQHPILTEWTRARAVDADVTIPYHPAAVQFYKERGVWPAKMDEVQRKLLALNH